MKKPPSRLRHIKDLQVSESENQSEVAEKGENDRYQEARDHSLRQCAVLSVRLKISVDQEENAELKKITSDTLNRILEGIDIHLKFRHDNVMNVINNMENRVKLEMDSLQKVEL